MDDVGRPDPADIIKMMKEGPEMVTLCLDAPVTSVPTAVYCRHSEETYEKISRQKSHTAFMKPPSPQQCSQNRGSSEINLEKLKVSHSSAFQTITTTALSTSVLEVGTPMTYTESSPNITHVFATASPAGTPVFDRKSHPSSTLGIRKTDSSVSSWDTCF